MLHVVAADRCAAQRGIVGVIADGDLPLTGKEEEQ
jgi:hypothetical protein